MKTEKDHWLNRPHECPNCKKMTKWYDEVSKFIVKYHCGSCKLTFIEIHTSHPPSIMDAYKNYYRFAIPYEDER